jgi:glycosyltransferase 2 family protein
VGALLPDNLKQFGQKTAWIWTLVLTILVVVWFASTTNLASIREALDRVGTGALVILAVCLTMNMVLEVIWLTLICRGQNAFRGSLRVTGWYMLATIVLPARLGDVAWMYLMHKWLSLPGGRAVFVALYHRLLDFIVTSLFFAIAVLIAGTGVYSGGIWFIATGAFLVLATIVLYLDFFLGLAARLLIQTKRIKELSLLNLLLRQILQVRIWYRHQISKRVLVATFSIIVLRWIFILIGIGVLIYSVAGGLSWQDALLATNVYVYVSIIPLQALGGFGIGEASLAALLVVYGLPLGIATAISLLIRVAINIGHFIFWLIVFLYFRISPGARQVIARS